MKENARARFGSASLFTLSLFLPFQACPKHNKHHQAPQEPNHHQSPKHACNTAAVTYFFKVSARLLVPSTFTKQTTFS